MDYGLIYPAKYAVGKAATIEANSHYSRQSITLSPASPALTIDYGTEAAGFPFFDVSDLTGPSQIEVKYTEQYPGLDAPQGDGPWTFVNGLANTFRIETFNLTETGLTQSFFVQGGQRWQSIRLLTNTSVTIRAVGLKATSAHVPVQNVPAKLSTSNSVYNEIWNLGARAVQAACVDAGNAPSTWEVTGDGVLIRGQQTFQYIEGLDFANYTLSFSTKIERGGTGWRVASSTTPTGALFILTSEYPEGSTFLNTNRSLVPPNTLVFNTPTYIVNQTTSISGYNQYFPLDQSIEEGRWYNISTTISGAGYNVTLDCQPIAFVDIAEAAQKSATYFGPGQPTKGSWGFGPFQDEVAYVRDVNVLAENGTTLYSNDFTTSAVLEEYTDETLSASVCLDGAKRDRLVWTGDFYHTAKIIPASTNRLDYILGTIDYVYKWQAQDGPSQGLVPIVRASPAELLTITDFIAESMDGRGPKIQVVLRKSIYRPNRLPRSLPPRYWQLLPKHWRHEEPTALLEQHQSTSECTAGLH